MNNKIKISLCINLLIAGKAMGMDQASPPSYQSLDNNSHAGNCANYPANAGPLETELVDLTRQLNDNAKTLALAARQQAASEKALPLAVPVIAGFVNGILDIHKAAFVDQQYFWKPASGAFCNATLGLGCLLYALISHENAKKQKQDLGVLMHNKHETQTKHDKLFEQLYNNETHLVGERNLTRSELMNASAVSLVKTMYQLQLKDMYTAAGQEEAQRAGLYCLMALCGYNMVKDSYFLSFMNSDPANTLTYCSALINGAGFIAGGTLTVNSLLQSDHKKQTIEGLLRTLDRLNTM